MLQIFYCIFEIGGPLDTNSLARVDGKVTTCLGNLDMSGKLTAVGEMSGILLKVRDM